MNIRTPIAMIAILLAHGCGTTETVLERPDAGGFRRDASTVDAPMDAGRDAGRVADGGVPVSDAGPRACEMDAQCDDGNPCTVGRCGTSRFCEQLPVPLESGERVELPFLIHDAVRHRGSTWAVGVEGDELVLADFGDGTEVLERRVLGPANPGWRDAEGTGGYFSALVSTGTDLAVVTPNGGGLDLRLASRPAEVSRLAPPDFDDLHHPRLAFSGTHVVVAVHGDSGSEAPVPMLAWAQGGRWTTDVDPLGDDLCPVPAGGSRVRCSVGQRVAHFDATGRAVLYSDGGANVLRVRAFPGGHELDEVAGVSGMQNVIAVLGGVVVGAQWTTGRRDSLGAGAFEAGGLDPIDYRFVEMSSLNGWYMESAYCASRFIFVDRAYSAELGGYGALIRQMTTAGDALAEPLMLPSPSVLYRSWPGTRIVCTPRGIQVFRVEQAHVLTCDPPAPPTDGGVPDAGVPPSDAGPPALDAGVCSTPRTVCGPECVDTSSDDAHCGGCGLTCGLSELSLAPNPAIPTQCSVGECGATPFTFTRASCDEVCAATDHAGAPMRCVDSCRFTAGASEWGAGSESGAANYFDPGSGASRLVALGCDTTPADMVTPALSLESVRCCCAATF